MRREQHAGAPLLRLQQNAEDEFLALRVERGERLVEQHERGRFGGPRGGPAVKAAGGRDARTGKPGLARAGGTAGREGGSPRAAGGG